MVRYKKKRKHILIYSTNMIPRCMIASRWKGLNLFLLLCPPLLMLGRWSAVYPVESLNHELKICFVTVVSLFITETVHFPAEERIGCSSMSGSCRFRFLDCNRHGRHWWKVEKECIFFLFWKRGFLVQFRNFVSFD